MFPRLLADAVHGLPVAGHAPADLDLGAVVTAMNKNPDRPRYQQIGWTPVGLTGELPAFLPNPRYRTGLTDIDLQLQQAAEWEKHAERREVEFRRRFLVRAMASYGEANSSSWWFVGRQAALTEVRGWLADPSPAAPALVVTGGPGTGKTALLGLVAALTHPERRRTVPIDVLELSEDALPEVGDLDVVIYAGGLRTEEVLAGLAAAARVPVGTVGEFLQRLDGAAPPSSRPCRPFTALIDALDEAANPHDLLSRLIQPLIQHGQGRIRLLLGTRPHLLNLLRGDSGPRVSAIALDGSAYADPRAVAAYTVRGLLEASSSSPYARAPIRDVRAVAAAVADAAGTSFLVARITARTLAAAGKLPDAGDPGWRASLPRLPGEAMSRDLDTRLGPDGLRARDLLRPLAYAEGQGLPWEDIWAALASRIAGRAYNDDDLLWLRANAGSYVVEATDAGRSAYRLYHQALVEHLRDDASGAQKAADIHHAYVEVLLSRVPRGADGSRVWARAHPYTRAHLATHAAASGQIDELLEDAEYLVYADPATLLAALHQATKPAGHLVGVAYRASAGLHRHLIAERRRQILAIDASRVGAAPLALLLTESQSWTPRWSTGALISPALRAELTGHGGSVNAVGCAVVDGVPVAVTGEGNYGYSGYGYSYEGSTVRIWDLRTGAQRAVLTGHTGRVKAVSCAVVDGVPVAVTGDDGYDGYDDYDYYVDHEGAVRVWDLRAGVLRTVLSGHTGPVKAVGCAVVDGVPVAVTGGGGSRGGEVRVWDLRTGVLRTVLSGHAGSVNAVGCAVVAGVPVAVTGDYGHGYWDDGSRGDGTARVWDLRTGALRAELTGHAGPVNAVGCAVVDGVPVAVTGDGGADPFYGFSSGAVRVWDLRTGSLRAVLAGHAGPVNAVACAMADGVLVAISGDDDGDVRVWDLRTGAQRAELAGHTASVNAVACAVVDGVPVAVTGAGGYGDSEGTARVWALHTDTARTVSAGHAGWVTAVGCAVVDGVPVAVTGAGGSRGGEVRIWNTRTGALRTVLSGHDGSVTAVGCGVVDGVPVAVIGDRDGGTDGGGAVRVWDLRTGALRTVLSGHDGSVTAVGCAVVDGVPVAVTAVGGTPSVGRAVAVWDLRTGARLFDLINHGLEVTAVDCAVVDGVPVAVTGEYGYDYGYGRRQGGTVRVWDLRTGAELAELAGLTTLG
jgi:WD40 repeat protein